MRWTSSGLALTCALASTIGCKRASPSETAAPLPMMAPAPAAVAVPGKHATLPAAPTHVGSVITVTRDSTTHGFGQQHTDRRTFDMTEHWVRRLEVLAVDGTIVTRARITFPEESFEYRRDQQALPWSPTWRGHSYLAEWGKGALSVKREDGAALTDDEDRRLRSNLYSDLGRPDVVGDALSGHPLESGAVIALPASELAASMFAGVTLSQAEARLIDVRGDTAVIEVHVVGEVSDADGHQTFEGRDIYEWSIATGLTTHLADSSAFRGNTGATEIVNAITGTVSFAYADSPVPAERPNTDQPAGAGSGSVQ